MYILGYFFIAVAKVLDLVLTLYLWVIVIRAVLSWVNPDPYNPVVNFVHRLTEPVLSRVRSKLPIGFGGLDFSPLLVLAAIYFLNNFLVQSIMRLGNSLL